MPRLTEQEQQEIIRFLEAGKPLPDKYCFLLFDDKREVELVWNGKTKEVCNVSLPFQRVAHECCQAIYLSGSASDYQHTCRSFRHAVEARLLFQAD